MTLKKRTKISCDKIGNIVCYHVQDPEKWFNPISELVPPF